jgi:hypothetical protein
MTKTVLCVLATHSLATAEAAAQQSETSGHLGFLGFDAVASKPFIESFRRDLIELAMWKIKISSSTIDGGRPATNSYAISVVKGTRE